MSPGDQISLYFLSIIIFREFLPKGGREDLLPLFRKILEGLVFSRSNIVDNSDCSFDSYDMDF